jgi:endonuclease/exonuclease/phosphatase family metal-dependent hydrolase
MSAFQKAKQIHSRQRRVGLRNSDPTPFFADAAQHLGTNRLESTHGPNVQAQHLRPWSASDTMSFGVLTLNLWNINERLDARYVALEVGLKRLRPDIICLQEVDRDLRSGRSQSELIAKMCSHLHVAEGNGLAIVSSIPIVWSGHAPLPEFPGNGLRQALSAQLLVDSRPLLVTTTHLASPPEMIQERRKQVEMLLASINRLRSTEIGIPKIICGDFNDVVESPAVRTLLDSDEDFHDVFAECHPNDPGSTYACRNRHVDRSWTVDERIDYIFATRDLVPQECSVVFDGSNGFDVVSDHFGVFCRLKFASQPNSAPQSCEVSSGL